MATFSLGGKDYHLRLTHGLVRRVAAESGVDFYALADDPQKYVDAVVFGTHRVYPGVYAAVREQTTLGYEAWLDPLDADAAAAIRVALVEAFSGYFPGLPTSQLVRGCGGPAAYLARADRLAAAVEPTTTTNTNTEG